MWILIFWLSTPFSGSSTVAKQPTLAVHSQEFGNERACKDALTAMNKVNVGELKLLVGLARFIEIFRPD